jgi:hypothetical protein
MGDRAMMDFLKSKRGVLVTAIVVIAFGVVTAWAINARYEAREAKQTQQRIERDAKSSINNATKDIKLCPLSNPDCNKR